MQQDESLREELLAEVEAIAAILVEHAPESETLGLIDVPTLEALRQTRLLRIYCSRELGGLELDPVTWVEILEALARTDASASWVVGILGGGRLNIPTIQNQTNRTTGREQFVEKWKRRRIRSTPINSRVALQSPTR